MRNMIVACILFLALCFAGCDGNGQETDTTPIQQESSGSSEQTSAVQETDKETDKATDESTEIPNEADDDYTKRY